MPEQPTIWNPPPFRRPPAKVRDRYRRQGRCVCGAGLYPTRAGLVLQSHHPRCPALERHLEAHPDA